MCVEHEATGILVTKFEYAALRLSLHYRVGVFAGRQTCAGWKVMKEVPVQVKRIDRVKFQHVYQEDAHELAGLDSDRVLIVVERNGIDGIEVVLAVEIDVETVHHHDQLVIGMRPALLRLDDECAVQTL